jgi:hypothetical protein
MALVMVAMMNWFKQGLSDFSDGGHETSNNIRLNLRFTWTTANAKISNY